MKKFDTIWDWLRCFYKKDELHALVQIDTGADLEVRHPVWGTTLLMLALKEYPRIVKPLLEKGVDVHAQDRNGHSALFHAMFDAPEYVMLLRQYSKDPKKLRKEDEVLIFLALQKAPEVARALIADGVDVTVKDEERRTTLMHAVMNCPELVEPLLKAGADVNAAAKDYQTALMLATGKNVRLIPTLLHYRARADEHTKDGYNPLFFLLVNNQISDAQRAQYVPILTRAGVYVDDRDDENDVTPLVIAAQQGFVHTAKALLEACANPDMVNKYGVSPLVAALMVEDDVDNSAMIKVLVEGGASIDGAARAPLSPLLHATIEEQEAHVNTLLELGASPWTQTYEGKTAADIGLKSSKPAIREAFQKVAGPKARLIHEWNGLKDGVCRLFGCGGRIYS